MAQHQAIAITKELNLSPDDPLYPIVSSAANKISRETMESMISPISKTEWMAKLMDFATKGKLQFGLFFIVWLLFATVSVTFLPVRFM